MVVAYLKIGLKPKILPNFFSVLGCVCVCVLLCMFQTGRVRTSKQAMVQIYHIHLFFQYSNATKH